MPTMVERMAWVEEMGRKRLDSHEAPLRIIGIDPGTQRMGYGVIDLPLPRSAEGIKAIAWGVLSVKSGRPLEERLWQLYQELVGVIRRFDPREVAVEEPFVAKNARSALAVGQAQGIALLAAASAAIPVWRYPPRRVKQLAAYYGAGSKGQVSEMVRLQLGLEAVPQPDDAADALAVALCHLHYRSLERALSRQEGGSG